MLRTARRLVNVEYALPLARSGGGRQRAGLPGLVAGPVEVMGHPVAAGRAAALVDRAERFAVEIIGRQDAVVGRHEDGGMLVTVQHPGNGGMGVCREYFHGLPTLSYCLSNLAEILVQSKSARYQRVS